MHVQKLPLFICNNFIGLWHSLCAVNYAYLMIDCICYGNCSILFLSYMKILSHCVFIFVYSLFIHTDALGHLSKDLNAVRPTIWAEEESLGSISEELKTYLKEGNAKNLAKYFGSNLTLSLLGENGVYTKYQSEIMLGTFFNQHKPKTVKLTQNSSTNNGYQFFTFSLTTEQASYRVFIKIGTGSNHNTIEELRIDKS